MARNAAATGSPQVLVIIDTCHAGAALPPAGTAIALAQAAHPPDAERVWAGVLVSARSGEPAEDGAFGPHLHRLLTEGPAGLAFVVVVGRAPGPPAAADLALRP